MKVLKKNSKKFKKNKRGNTKKSSSVGLSSLKIADT
jgi:hypothetical protein